MRINLKDLNTILFEMAAKLNLATSKEQAIKMGRDKYLYIEYAAIYGGYRIVNVGVNNGAHYGAFGGNGTESRIKAAEMMAKLDGILTGIEICESARIEADKVVKPVKFNKAKAKALKSIKKFGY